MQSNPPDLLRQTCLGCWQSKSAERSDRMAPRLARTV